ncbi:hypothetical protein [Paraburkholderia graminis]|uniref:hypothetical protein n=1 Tax=Paraburkholderia graminis TaxID=60548 RepID=UPI002794CC6C|nr:hypothetical protein [Paraburkholderia graminis]MDQ0621017.1 hypothetical protein [Paraburkholderia graminis]
MTENQPGGRRYREFMRARRPELYSDTLRTESSEMDRRQFEFHLHSLTSRKEETAFENFARALAEKELCPNLIPQTGPTGGGDSKTDTETYPVAESLAILWYVGNPSRSAEERWAFAVSAKAKWKPKIDSDVAKIVATGRPYTLIYFVSNQAIRDKDRADTEDTLKTKYGIEVRILDRSWIVEKVDSGNRWSLVSDTLQFELPRKTKPSPGPLDTGRLRELESLDREIESTAGRRANFELVEESLRSALLARSLDRPRIEVDGRFDRAERLARQVGNGRQEHRIRYYRAWTALWWFNDASEALRLYDLLAAEAFETNSVWDLERLVNLWLALLSGAAVGERTVRLRNALLRHAGDLSPDTSSLWARTQIIMMDLVSALRRGEPVELIFDSLRDIFDHVRRRIEFPMESVVRLVRELADIIGDTPAYDRLLDSVIEIERERHGDRAAGEMRLERGLQKLSRKKPYDAIDDLTKAQFLLAQEERRDEFIAALAATGLAYESVGLLFAARASLVSALDRCFYTYLKDGTIDGRALPILKRLAWLELQLGRAPYALAWIKMIPLMRVVLRLDDEKLSEITEELLAFDRVLGILILKTSHDDWSQLARLPDILHSLELHMSRAAALFMLGHEETVQAEYGSQEDDLQDFFSKWTNAPAADDLPDRPGWHIGTTILTTVVLGSQINVAVRGGVVSALLGESLIGFLEAFYSTAATTKSLISPRADLTIEVRQSDGAKAPFALRTSEDECGETKLVVSHPILPIADLVDEGFERGVLEFFAHVSSELQLGIEKKLLEDMFMNWRAPDRALQVARSILSVTSILGESPAARAEDWVGDQSITEYALLRKTAWKSSGVSEVEVDRADEPPSFASGPPPDDLFGADALKHRDMGVMSPINIPLWDRAKWKGVGVAVTVNHSVPPAMILVFQDVAAGRKIFRGWRKKIGSFDSDGWLGVTVITGINRERPLDYRVAIGVSERYMRDQISRKLRFFTMVCRMHDMVPVSGENLERLLESYRRTGTVIIQPGRFHAEHQGLAMEEEDFTLGIRLANISVTAAWQVGPDSPLIGAMRGIETPVIPSGEANPPFYGLKQRLNESKRKHES